MLDKVFLSSIKIIVLPNLMVVVMFTYYVLVLTYTKTLEYRQLNHTFLKESFYLDTEGCYYKKELAVMYNIPCTYMTNENVEKYLLIFQRFSYFFI